MTQTKLSLSAPKTEVTLPLDPQEILGQGQHKAISEVIHPSEPIEKVIISEQDLPIISEGTIFSEAVTVAVFLTLIIQAPIGTVPLATATIGTVPLEAATI